MFVFVLLLFYRAVDPFRDHNLKIVFTGENYHANEIFDMKTVKIASGVV